MQRLEIPFKQADKGVTPGVLRGSGATHLYLELKSLGAAGGLDRRLSNFTCKRWLLKSFCNVCQLTVALE